MTILVDMHNQLLQVPGSSYTNEEETIRILKLAADDGITHMIATPPFRYGDFVTDRMSIKSLVNSLNDKVVSLAIPITILPGMEITLYEQLAQDLKVNAVPLADTNKYVLIVFQDDRIPPFALSVLFEIQLMGYIPIIANVERIQELMTNPKKILEFINRGALVHVSAASIIGLNGRKTREISVKLCKKGLVHFISSFSSGDEKRPSHLRGAYKYLERRMTPSTVKKIMGNTVCVLQGTDFHSLTGKKHKKNRYK
ncbi:CpsB/CapC family capsule biosynthesis tyrosine phosphatase [Sporosarcina sp. E16_8]|uniref:tyrosine-protein phosphatase n=1 Tax=Sporosarcina sp. E16_8 TaxID=2789295 RepID=UPI001A92DADB|nr:CpsB/CapC family capsule biosynthesis tyrosine phosphatase [Sporosarcina sp. E16_8]MBO0588598.1 hypothetical protein [Sporosarcina sp. E16_8]